MPRFFFRPKRCRESDLFGRDVITGTETSLESKQLDEKRKEPFSRFFQVIKVDNKKIQGSFGKPKRKKKFGANREKKFRTDALTRF